MVEPRCSPVAYIDRVLGLPQRLGLLLVEAFFPGHAVEELYLTTLHPAAGILGGKSFRPEL